MRFRFACRALLLAGLLAPCVTAAEPPLVAPTEKLSAAEQLKKFHLPPGFEIQLVAAEPAIHKPMNITFDRAGRLFVTDTLEYPYPAKEGVVPRDTVKILVDRNFDGAADDITTFVDELNIPLGVMPLADGALVYTIGSILRCRDTNRDGRADVREPLYTGFGSRDTHGMVNSFTHGLDGWLYACHGFNNDSTTAGTDGQAIKMNSGNTFRMRFDGSHVEYFTHGQVNPFGLAFDTLNNLYSADCHTMPVYMLLRGAYYPSFGKAHDGLDFGPTMIGHSHGSTGIGGVAYYAAEQFPAEYRDTIFIGNPVTGRINHDRLKPHGSTLEAIEQPDFLSCDDPWFRPVNIQVGPDGALYIADFYNRIIGHYEVPLEHPGRDRDSGRIWRVVYTGKGVEKPERTTAAVPINVQQASQRRLIDLLGDANFTLRTQATHELVERVGRAAIEPLTTLLSTPGATPHQRLHAMWALERLGGLDDRLIDTLSRDPDAQVRTHVYKMLAERKADDVPLARAALADKDAFVRRAAAEALDRHPRIENVLPLLELWAATDPTDTHLIHVVRMALRDQLREPAMYAALSSVVADDRGRLDRLANVSLGVPTADAATFLWSQLQANPALPARGTTLHHVTRYIDAARLPEVFAFAIGQRQASPAEQAGLFREVAQGCQERNFALPAEVRTWANGIADALLASDDEGQTRAGIDLARQSQLPLFDKLASAAGPKSRFGGLRTAAIDACVSIDAKAATPLLAAIVADAAEPMNLRQHAATALIRVNDDISRQQAVTLLEYAPQGLAREIAAALAESKPGAEALLTTIASGKASPRLLQVTAVINRLRARRLDQFDERLAKLTAGLPPEDERVRNLIDQRRQQVANGKPDPTAGAAIFEKNCAACHRIGDKGAKIGPNLDGVGVRGIDRLLEDILDPNRNVDQAFRTTQLALSDGRIVSGLVLREEGPIVVLADAQGKELRVSQDDIEERKVNQLSVMPGNVPDLVSEADFVHLLGYLLSQRAAQPAAQQ